MISVNISNTRSHSQWVWISHLFCTNTLTRSDESSYIARNLALIETSYSPSRNQYEISISVKSLEQFLLDFTEQVNVFQGSVVVAA